MGLHSEKPNSTERERSRETRGIATFFEAEKLDEERANEFLRTIENIIENPDRYIDKGGAATVYRFAKHLCIKLLEDRKGSEAAAFMDLGNSVEVEANFLRSLQDVEVSGVRVPRCYGYWQDTTDREKSAILMEELDAVNLQHVLNGDEELPETCDPDTFNDALTDFLDYLHEEKAVLHGDLEARNVMIDRASGLPRVIDFGRAKAISRLTDDVKQKLIQEEVLKFDKFAVELAELTADKK